MSVVEGAVAMREAREAGPSATPLENGLWNSLAVASGSVAGLVGSILIVRSLSPESYGIFSYYLWLAGVLGVLGTLAFPVALTKLASEFRGRGLHHESVVLTRSVIGAVVGINLVIGAVTLALALTRAAEGQAYLIVIALMLVPNALAAILGSVFRSRQHYRPLSVIVTIGASLQLGFVVVAYLNDWGVLGFLVAVSAVNVVVAGSLSVLLLRSGMLAARHRTRLRRSTATRYGAFLLPQTGIILLDAVIWQRSEIFFLERYSDLTEVGMYNLAFTIFAMFLALGWALLNGFMPALSHDFGGDRWDRVTSSIAQALLLAVAFSAPVAFGGLSTLEALVTLVYGAEMAPAVPVVHILFLGLLPGVVAAVFGLVAGALNRPWLIIPVGLIAMTVNIGLDLLLIPSWGAIGGAGANVGAQLLFMVLLFLVVRRLWAIRVPWRAIAVIVLIAAGTTYVLPEIIQALLPPTLGLIVSILVAAGSYLAALWGFGYVRILRGAGGGVPAGTEEAA